MCLKQVKLLQKFKVSNRPGFTIKGLHMYSMYNIKKVKQNWKWMKNNLQYRQT